MSDSEDQDYIFFGTPLADEDAAHAPRKALDPAATRAAPVWQQVPTDEQGRKRFHGAFTGGFSAGYYNTVGSKEGWQPSTFRSSRSDRAAVKAQSVDDFLDEDERQERSRITLFVKPEFDTFGSGAAEAARARSQADADARPSLIPGPAIPELLTPVNHSLGALLLQKMGWRPGRGVVLVTPEAPAQRDRKRRWGTVAGVSLDNTPLYVLQPKQDRHGLGFDPFQGADEFRAAKAARGAAAAAEAAGAASEATAKLGMGAAGGRAGVKRPRGVAFGGFTEDGGMDGYMEDYVDDDDEVGRPTKQSVLMGGVRRGFTFELAGSESDDEGGRGTSRRRPLLLEASDAPRPLPLPDAALLRRGGDFIPGFKKSDQQVTLPVYPPPVVPPGWVAHHVFPEDVAPAPQGPLPAPPDAPPPADPELRRDIDSLAALVARSGEAVERLARQQAREAAAAAGAVPPPRPDAPPPDPAVLATVKFGFLLGGEGAVYYAWRLHKIRAALSVLLGPQKAAGPSRPPGGPAPPAAPQPPGHVQTASGRRQPLTIEQRMALLGEEALPVTAPPPPTAQPPAAAAAPQIAKGDLERIKESMGRMFVRADNQADRVLIRRKALHTPARTPWPQDMGGKEGEAQEGLRSVPAPGDASAGAGVSSAAQAMLAGLKSRFAPSGGAQGAAEVLAPLTAGLMKPSAGSAGRGGAQPTDAQRAAPQQPRRWFEDWRPDPVLCKRFNVPDPYKGKPQAPQQSKFKTDELALPETQLGLGGMEQEPRGDVPIPLALPPPPPPAPTGLGGAAQLPGPPPLPPGMAEAVARAQAIAKQLTQQQAGTVQPLGQALPPPEPPPPAPPPPPQPAAQPDARSYAVSFLDSLAASGVLGGGGGEGAPQPLIPDRPPPAPAPAPTAAASAQAPPAPSTTPAAPAAEVDPALAVGSGDFPTLDRPLDIFKAIFEGDGEEEEEEEQEEEPPRASKGAGDGPPAPPPGAGTDAQPTPGVTATSQQTGLAGALRRAQELAAQALAERQAVAGPPPPALQPPTSGTGAMRGPHLPQPGPGLPAAAVDPEVQQRILAALAALKSGKKSKKSKERDKKRSKEKDKKGSKSRKSKHKSSASSKRSSGSRNKAAASKRERKQRRSSRGATDSEDSGGSGSSSGETESSTLSR